MNSLDFDQIARQLTDQADAITLLTKGMIYYDIKDALRQAWNARGEADAKAVLSHPLTPGTGINRAEIARNAELVKAIKVLDR